MNKTSIIAIIIALLVGFGAGMTYGKSGGTATTPQDTVGGFGAGRAGAGGNRAARGGGFGGGTSGEVIAKDASSITVKTRDGSTKIVFVSGTTQVVKTAAGSQSDISMGTNVTAIGPANTDGSVNAQSIQIRPAGMNFGGGRGSSTPTQQ